MILSIVHDYKARKRERLKKKALSLLIGMTRYDNYPYARHNILEGTKCYEPELLRLKLQQKWLKTISNKVKVHYIQNTENGKDYFIEWHEPGEITADDCIDMIEDPFRVLNKTENSRYIFLTQYIRR